MPDTLTKPQWLTEAETIVKRKRKGTTFLFDSVTLTLRERGFDVDLRQMGPLATRLAKQGLIAKTGNALPAITSRGGLKTEWVRV
jgi:hypothetical protein